MSWYVLQCRSGQEEEILVSCRQHLSKEALEEAFIFRCQRLWRLDGVWKPVIKEMFPGYVFLQSSNPKALSKELESYRKFLRVLEENGYLISVYEEEEEYLRKLCGDNHFMGLSYGFKDQEEGDLHMIRGPLCGQEERIVKINWHKRFAILELPVARKQAVVWAGVEYDGGMVS